MEQRKTTVSKWLAFSVISMTLLSGCDPDRGGAAVTCPVRPDLPQRAEQGPPYAERMQSFFDGKLPEPTRIEKPLLPVTK